MQSTPAPGLLRRASSFGGLTLLSRATGVLRDIAIAAAYGAGPASDAFVLAFRIPNALRRLFADGALSAAFVPALVREAGRDPRELAPFIARLAGTLSVVVSLVAGAGMLLAEPLARLFAPGVAVDSDQGALIAGLLRITFPFLACVSLAALAGAVLVSQGRFSRWALAPALLNLAMATGAAWGSPHLPVPVEALAWAVLVGGVAQAAWLWQGVARLGLLRWPRWGGRDARVRAVAGAMLPTLAGASVAQVNLLFASAMASLLSVGSQTWLFQADRFLELPLALFGASIGIVLLPTLAREFAQDVDRAAGTLAWALRWVALVTLPAATGLVLLAEPLMLAFFRHGQYTAHDARMAAAALAQMSLGLPALAAIKVMLPACHARGDLALPLRASCIAVACNVACAVLMLAAAVFDGPGVGWRGALARPGLHALLASAGAIANTCNAVVLWRGLRRAGVIRPGAGAPLALLRIVVACAVMAFGVIALRGRMDFESTGTLQRLVQLLVLAGAGSAVFAVAWHVVGGRRFLRPRST